MHQSPRRGSTPAVGRGRAKRTVRASSTIQLLVGTGAGVPARERPQLEGPAPSHHRPWLRSRNR